ncbi:MAG TPA: 50S ribosomal protein L20 [Verrucomicrobiae bacterium]|jgi:large subunit ribosomal protein L20|nr:50S ribosomal protein L20 [Verrucomicrobiae bacterium]
MRVTNAPASRKRRIRTIKDAKGFRGRRSKLYRYAADATDHAKQYAFRDRKVKKRTFRQLWQVRINASARAAGTTYSRFMEGLKAAKVTLDRKVLADIAATDNAAFGELVKVAVKALQDKGVKAVKAVKTAKA